MIDVRVFPDPAPAVQGIRRPFVFLASEFMFFFKKIILFFFKNGKIFLYSGCRRSDNAANPDLLNILLFFIPYLFSIE
jgi:hypothetical protein